MNSEIARSRLVVGVDGSDGARASLRYAFLAAARRRAGSTWWWPTRRASRGGGTRRSTLRTWRASGPTSGRGPTPSAPMYAGRLRASRTSRSAS